MPSLFFSKVIPGGNATIILHEPDTCEGKLGPVAARLMHPMHIQAEQVGALRLRHEKLPFLEMMGGEFCVNATRSAAFLLAGMGRLQPFQLPVTSSAAAVHEQAFSKQADRETIWTGSMRVSGMPDPLSILVCHDERSLHLYFQSQRFFSAGEEEKAVLCRTGADEEQLLIPLGPDFGSSNHDQFWPDDLPTSLYCAARVDCSLSVTTCREVANGAHLVSMPGMAHLLVSADTHPLPDLQGSGWKKDSAAWRRKSGIADAPASGVIWYRKESGRFTIWPAVEVKASASEHLETACGSASLALALKEKCLDCCSRPFVEVVQPSGQSLFVFHEHAQGRGNKLSLRAAWVAGPVSLAAQGRAFL